MPLKKIVFGISRLKETALRAKKAKAAVKRGSEKRELTVFAPAKYPGKIEITQGTGLIASIGFDYGERLKERPVEVKARDLYINAGNLNALGVGVSYRGMGLATRLLKSLIRFAKTNNAGDIYLRVNKHNLNAIRLYTKIGFKAVKDLNSSEHLMAFYKKV